MTKEAKRKHFNYSHNIQYHTHMIEERADELVRVGHLHLTRVDALDIIYLAEAVQMRYGISKDRILISAEQGVLHITIKYN